MVVVYDTEIYIVEICGMVRFWESKGEISKVNIPPNMSSNESPAVVL
jgi:hypothetical protein